MLIDLKYLILELERSIDPNNVGNVAYWWSEGKKDSISVIQNRIDILKKVQESAPS